MKQAFRLHWLREDGCDAGTLLRADQLDPQIQQRVLELIKGEAGEFAIRLPFLDKRENRRRDEILSGLTLIRHGNAIVCSPPVAYAVRDRAAQLALTNPAWTSAPSERDRSYYPIWREISMTLQGLLRRLIAEEYFRDARRFEDRESAYPMLAYRAARLFHGREPTEFTYDLRDYPECKDTLKSTWKMAGQALQIQMAEMEERLHNAGMPALARRYAPVWYEDVLVAVRNRPRRYVDLLARESLFINGLIDLGTERSVAAVIRFARTANLALRKIHGMDVRHMALACLDEATRILRSHREVLSSSPPLVFGEPQILFTAK
jgi:hypothetical protein